MHFQFDMSALVFPKAQAPADPGMEPTHLLRQLVEIQQEQLGHLRALVTAQDASARWRAFRPGGDAIFLACRKAVARRCRSSNARTAS
jgi:hypothetical protein